MFEFYTPNDILYDLRTNNFLQPAKTNMLVYGNNSLLFRGSILWNTLSDTIKLLKTQNNLKISLRAGKETLAVALSANEVYIDSCIYLRLCCA